MYPVADLVPWKNNMPTELESDHGITFEPKDTAVVLVEFQRQWTDLLPYRPLIARQLRRREVLQTTRRFVESARATGAAIVHAPLVLDPAAPAGLVGRLTRGRVFTQDTPKAAITDGIQAPHDTVVRGRTAFDAFVNSDLDDGLRRLEVKHLLIGGFVTDQCVAKTLRTALDRGWDAYLLTDASATFTDLMQRRVERRFGERALSCEQALGRLRAERPVAAESSQEQPTLL